MPAFHDVSRRQFVVTLAEAATALGVAGACGDGQIGPALRGPVPGGDPLTIIVASFPQLATEASSSRSGANGP